MVGVPLPKKEIGDVASFADRVKNILILPF